jgi:hypothetical protein
METMEIFDPLEFLSGSWDIVRSITDHRTDLQSSFEGTGTFAPVLSDDGSVTVPMRYDEIGVLHLGDHHGEARRSLDYRLVSRSVVMLYFTDGRPFVDLDLTDGRWTSSHPCGEDLYDISTLVTSETTVEERWRVQGPSKSYEAITSLTRCDIPTPIMDPHPTQ